MKRHLITTTHTTTRKDPGLQVHKTQCKIINIKETTGTKLIFTNPLYYNYCDPLLSWYYLLNYVPMKPKENLPVFETVF